MPIEPLGRVHSHKGKCKAAKILVEIASKRLGESRYGLRGTQPAQSANGQLLGHNIPGPQIANQFSDWVLAQA
jgi:hypothetical protein